MVGQDKTGQDLPSGPASERTPPLAGGERGNAPPADRSKTPTGKADLTPPTPADKHWNVSEHTSGVPSEPRQRQNPPPGGHVPSPGAANPQTPAHQPSLQEPPKHPSAGQGDANPAAGGPPSPAAGADPRSKGASSTDLKSN